MLEKVKMHDESGGTWELGYFIQKFMGDDVVYGIKIEKRAPDGRNESQETCGLTTSYEEAEGWVRKMAKGQVTPIALHDIVDDFME